MMIRTILAVLAALTLAGCGTTGWKEEVELHDGRKIIVDRYQSYGGLHEIGQGSPIKTQEVRVVMPGRHWPLSFKSEYSEDVGRANLLMLALHIKDDTPYIITEPNLCLAYNKWRRPNPPYVIFKHDGKDWKRIPLEELPAEFKTINLVIDTKNEEPKFNKLDVVPAEQVRKFNKELHDPEYQGILREPLPEDKYGCAEMISDGKGGWTGVGFFRDQPSYEACVGACNNFHIEEQYCPCHRYFK